MKLFLSIPAVFVVAAVAQTPPPKPANVPAPTITMMGPENAGPPPVVAPDKVILTVGDVKVTYAQFDEIITSLVPESYRQIARTSGRRQFAENLARMLVLSREGQKRKLDETQAYKTQVHFQSINLLAALAFAALDKEAKVPEEESQKYYEAHKDEYEQVHARHILIRMQGSPVPVKPGQKDLTEPEALAKALDLRKKIAAGADFGTLAMQESDDVSSGANGGELGTFVRGRMVPSFEQAAFSLKPGDLSEPVKSQFGFHLIKVEEHNTKPFDAVREEIEKKLHGDQTQRDVNALKAATPAVFDPEYFAMEKK